MKFDFRRDWKFCWDLSHVTVFSSGILYPSANYDATASEISID